MGMTPSLATGLTMLSEALDERGPALEDSLREFAATVRAAVSSYVGMRVTGGERSPALRFTLWGGDGLDAQSPTPVRASLALPLAHTGRRAIDIVLYAANSGAFVDLAADLAALVGIPLHAVDVDRHIDAAGEADDVTVLDAWVVDQAVGVLIGWGWTPERALRALDDQPADHAPGRVAAARRLLDDLESGLGGWWVDPS